MTTSLAPTAVQQDVITAWRLGDMPGKYGALLGAWTTGTAHDGQPLTSVTVRGRYAEQALRRFGADYGLFLTQAGDIKPRAEYSDTGITITWRTAGTWVQLTSDAA